MASPQHVTREAFLSNLRESGLLSPTQFTEVIEHLPDSPRGRVLARSLVEMGLLTRYQAEQLLAGRSLGFFLGKYRVLEEIGKGGMGRVFKAIHQTMNRVVALKVLAPHYGRTDRAQRLFTREVQAIARLSHPNIVTAYDAGTVGNRDYLVMEFVDGPSLDLLVRQQGALPVGQACAFIRQAALGLQYAFEQGMVHRDIKPGNLLLGRESDGRGIIKVLDFGLARLVEPSPFEPGTGDSILTRENVVMGTPDFVSPEQARSLHAADIRSDLYSLGCTFYFLLTGDMPFPGGTVLEKLIRHTTDMPVPLARRRPEVPAAVEAIVERLLAKDPKDRFQTPAELAVSLAPFAVDLPVAIARPSSEPAATSPGPDEDLFGPTPEAAPEQVSTLPPNFALTQHSTPLPRRPVVAPTPQDELRRRVLTAVGIAVGVIGALVGLIGLLWGR